MAKINGVPLIELLIERLQNAKSLSSISVVTSLDAKNDPLVEHLEELKIECFRGSEDDVLSRYLMAGRILEADAVVRITGDCPLIDPDLVDRCVGEFCRLKLDYLSNICPPTFPDGLDVEVFTMAALERVSAETQEAYDREHVTPYFRRNNLFRTHSVSNEDDLSDWRLTVDEPDDLEVVKNIFEYFSPNRSFSWGAIADLRVKRPDLFEANLHLCRNEGASMGEGQKLWKRAKYLIPGGNMLLSKRAEIFLPERWPTYFSRAKGCEVWDLTGNRYLDLSVMGIGTNILGYGNEEVDQAVRDVISNGNMSTLNCPEEVFLAEKLVEMHSWADMVRFARSGGEANAIAVRIARTASAKEKVAVCGYHGWHDWYLSANLSDGKNLDGHLLPGLEPNGIPRSLKNTVFPFSYNDYDGLEEIVKTNDIGVIKMEVSRNIGPENNFLERVRELATRRQIVLIFDECTSGFRQSFGGLHKIYGVSPDMAIFGKALGNGYAITAVLGRRSVMEAAQDTFISSTFWTERIGPTAALQALEVMEKIESWELITAIGETIRERWLAMAKELDLDIEVSGIPALSGFTFKSANNLAYKTLITQEMLNKGYLASNKIYVSTAHTAEILDGYFEALQPIFEQIKVCEEGGDVMELLTGPVCQSGFRRLN